MDISMAINLFFFLSKIRVYTSKDRGIKISELLITLAYTLLTGFTDIKLWLNRHKTLPKEPLIPSLENIE